MTQGKHNKQKQQVQQLFDTIAGGYDNPSMRLFPFVADKLVSIARLAPGEKVLDVATGTGMVAIAAAQMVAPQGRVMAIDMSQQMLDKADINIKKLTSGNVDLFEMDADSLDFRSNYFHAVLCSFGIFFLPDMLAGLKEWVRVTREGGRVAFTSFGMQAFQPMAALFRERIQEFGVELPDQEKVAWYLMSDPDYCEELQTQAGLKEVEVTSRQMGYHMNNADDWWEVVWNSGMRDMVGRLSADDLSQFRKQHLADVSALVTDKGLWMDVETIFSKGIKPEK
ncbi:MAG: methyltransferase domain-containing protein [Gammaproteobacteria bacterium]|nr:MAG: methyltransferase domain-containing protein [Gammaproteobacteria bacterium]